MIIELAQGKDKQKIAKLDSHIPSPRLGECIWNGQVYVLKDDSIKNGGQNHRVKDPVVGVLRYSLFWQTIPFLSRIVRIPNSRAFSRIASVGLRFEIISRIGSVTRRYSYKPLRLR